MGNEPFGPAFLPGTLLGRIFDFAMELSFLKGRGGGKGRENRRP
jgi:hypothetical protein